MEPYKVLTASIRSVPAMKYALGVAGLAAVIALVSAFRLAPSVAIVGSIVVVALMVVLFLFARLTATASRHFFAPVMVLMWALLVLFVSTATLLFTSAFFQWPRGLHELLAPAASTQISPIPKSPSVAIAPQLAAARAALTSRDYAAAWEALASARHRAPDAWEVQREQADVAMAWLREARVRDGQKFSPLVDQLLPVLYENLSVASGTRAADLTAHVGWGNFLKHRDGVRGLTVDAQYRAAIELEPVNPFAHAMLGHWLATQRRPLPEVNRHFQKVLGGGMRERSYVREMQLAALRWYDTPESAVELIRVSDEMRRAGEPLSSDTRASLFNAIYVSFGREAEGTLLSAFPAPGTQHLETFRWLTEGRDLKNDRTAEYFLARLTEASGDTAAALALYRAAGLGSTAFATQITAGIARCDQSLQAAAR